MGLLFHTAGSGLETQARARSKAVLVKRMPLLNPSCLRHPILPFVRLQARTPERQLLLDSSAHRMSNQAPAATADTSRIEAPVTWKAYLICMFASTGGLLFGYDSGYINGVIGNPIFIREVEGPSATSLTGSHQSLIVSILSAGTFFGALLAGDVADMLGRKWTIVAGGGIYILGRRMALFFLLQFRVLTSNRLRPPGCHERHRTHRDWAPNCWHWCWL